VLFPAAGKAQVYPLRPAAPPVTASNAAWQVNNEPIVLQGSRYYPTRSYRTYDAQVMAQIGLNEGVPIYADTTLEPYSVVYVPVGRERLRAYERLRDRELAGTTGSRAPSFPVASPSAPVVEEPIVPIPPAVFVPEPIVATSGSTAPLAVDNVALTLDPDRGRPARTHMESIPAPEANNGIWLQYNGARWYSAGGAVPFSPDRFTPIGEYRGFPVYRDATGDPNHIWVPIIRGGPLAPYTKR
jgi:hypothetical protein